MALVKGTVCEWTFEGSASNNVATATAPAATGNKRRCISSITISSNGQPAAAVAVTITGLDTTNGGIGTKTIQVPAAAFSCIHLTFVRALRGAPGGAVAVSIPALGSGITGTCSIDGYTSYE